MVVEKKKNKGCFLTSGSIRDSPNFKNWFAALPQGSVHPVVKIDSSQNFDSEFGDSLGALNII